MINRILDKYHNNEKGSLYKGYGLDGIKAVLEKTGSPQNKFLSFHIAGTNGKGSTAHYIESILRHSGYKTGLYTSPHLEKINERIKISGADIDDDTLEKCLTEIDDIAIRDNITLTYFDILTAAAFLAFSRAGIDAAVLETGLGGRKDSTNVVTPVCSILTGISLDHESILGKGIKNITAEKCGIIKSGIPVVSVNSAPEISSIITVTAAGLDAPLYTIDKSFSASGPEQSSAGTKYFFSFPELSGEPLEINITQIIPEQIINSSAAAAAVLITKKIFPNINTESIRAGLYKTIVKGRFEMGGKSPAVIFDPAHNPAAVESLVRCLDEVLSPEIKKIFIISYMKDKDTSSMTRIIKRFADKIIYLRLDDDRNYIPSAEDKFDGICSGAAELREFASSSGRDAAFIFTGSFRLYAAYRGLLLTTF